MYIYIDIYICIYTGIAFTVCIGRVNEKKINDEMVMNGERRVNENNEKNSKEIVLRL